MTERLRFALLAVIVALSAAAMCLAQLDSRAGSMLESPISQERVAFMAYRAALADFKPGQPQRAEDDLRQALRAAPGWANALDLLGFIAELTERSKEAAQHYRQAMEREPHDIFASQALKGLGEQVEAQGGEGAAEAYQLYRQGLDKLLLPPRRAGGYAALAGSPNPPLDDASRAAKALSSWPDAQILLGYCHELAGHRAEAVSAYRNALHFAPADLHAIEALVNLGYLPAVPGIRGTDTDAADLEQLVVDLINEERARVGLPRLTVNQTLVKLARLHSAEMRDLQYFSHESPTPELRGLRQRYDQLAHDRPRILGENVSRRYGWPSMLTAANVRLSHAGLMQSPPHRANMLNPEFGEIGVGFAINDRGDYWITEVFMGK